MKSITLLLILALSSATVLAEQDGLAVSDPLLFTQLRDATFVPLFNALQTGELDEIKTYLPDELYRQYETLFERNRGYGQFLRDYYADASFVLLNAIARDSTYTGSVEVGWPDGRRKIVKMQVKFPVDASP